MSTFLFRISKRRVLEMKKSNGYRVVTFSLTVSPSPSRLLLLIRVHRLTQIIRRESAVSIKFWERSSLCTYVCSCRPRVSFPSLYPIEKFFRRGFSCRLDRKWNPSSEHSEFAHPSTYRSFDFLRSVEPVRLIRRHSWFRDLYLFLQSAGIYKRSVRIST